MGVSCLQSVAMAVWFVFPVLARKRFEANDWQTLLITASQSVLFALSIFWNDLYTHRSFKKYLLTWWAVAGLPLALCAFATDYWSLFVPYLVACLGVAGYHPAGGDLLRAMYGPAARGRAYSLLWGSSMIVAALVGWGIGEWLERDENAFRYFLPLCAALKLIGVLIFIVLGKRTGYSESRTVIQHDERTLYQRVVEPVTHAREVLKADPVFARYEAAYMTYGVGWMIAYALLPMLVTDRLKMSYDQIAVSAQVAYLVALVVMLWPAGLMMDKLGPVRSTAISFGLLSVYPILYLWADGASGLAIASLAYGAAHAGASVGWMLGPVALAPSKEKAPQYVAIHATLVGVRGKLFQGLGVLLYVLTGSFEIPLVIATLAFLWSAQQMFALHKRMKRA